MIRNIIRNKTILAIASIVFGIFLMIARRSAVDLMIRVMGYGLLATAVAYCIAYFTSQTRDEVQLGYAVLALIGGLLVIWLAPAIVSIAPILAGILLIINGASDLFHAASGDSVPRRSAFASALIILLGLLILIRPGFISSAIVVVIGAAFVLNGLVDLDIIRRFW